MMAAPDDDTADVPRISPREAAACLGKDKYPSESAAQAALRYGRTHGHRLRTLHRLGAYQCRYCGTWHLGNS